MLEPVAEERLLLVRPRRRRQAAVVVPDVDPIQQPSQERPLADELREPHEARVRVCCPHAEVPAELVAERLRLRARMLEDLVVERRPQHVHEQRLRELGPVRADENVEQRVEAPRAVEAAERRDADRVAEVADELPCDEPCLNPVGIGLARREPAVRQEGVEPRGLGLRDEVVAALLHALETACLDHARERQPELAREVESVALRRDLRRVAVDRVAQQQRRRRAERERPHLLVFAPSVSPANPPLEVHVPAVAAEVEPAGVEEVERTVAQPHLLSPQLLEALVQFGSPLPLALEPHPVDRLERHVSRPGHRGAEAEADLVVRLRSVGARVCERARRRTALLRPHRSGIEEQLLGGDAGERVGAAHRPIESRFGDHVKDVGMRRGEAAGGR